MNLRDSVRLYSCSSFRIQLSLSSACLNQRGFGSKRKFCLTEVTGEFWGEKRKRLKKISINTEIFIHIPSIQGISRLGLVCFMCKGKTLTIRNILSVLAFGSDCSKNNNMMLLVRCGPETWMMTFIIPVHSSVFLCLIQLKCLERNIIKVQNVMLVGLIYCIF